MILLLDRRLFVQEVLILRIVLRYSQATPALPVLLRCVGSAKYRAAAHERQRPLLLILSCLLLVEWNCEVVSPFNLSSVGFVAYCFLHVRSVLLDLAELGPRALLAIQVSVAEDQLFVLYRVIVFIYFCPTLSFWTHASLEQFLFVHLQLPEKRWSHFQILPP